MILISCGLSGCQETTNNTTNNNETNDNAPPSDETPGNRLTLTASKTLLDQSPDRLLKDSTTVSVSLKDANNKPMKKYAVSFTTRSPDIHFYGENPVETNSDGYAEITAEIDKYGEILTHTSRVYRDTTQIIATCNSLGISEELNITVDVMDWVGLYYTGTSDITFDDERTAFYANGIEIKFAVNDPQAWHNVFDSSGAQFVSANQYRAFSLGQVKRNSTVYLFYQYKIASSQDPLDHGEIGQTYLHTYNSWVHNVAIVPPSSGLPSDEWGEFSYKIP
jgi:hypothetical protein